MRAMEQVLERATAPKPHATVATQVNAAPYVPSTESPSHTVYCHTRPTAKCPHGHQRAPCNVRHAQRHVPRPQRNVHRSTRSVHHPRRQPTISRARGSGTPIEPTDVRNHPQACVRPVICTSTIIHATGRAWPCIHANGIHATRIVGARPSVICATTSAINCAGGAPLSAGIRIRPRAIDATRGTLIRVCHARARRHARLRIRHTRRHAHLCIRRAPRQASVCIRRAKRHPSIHVRPRAIHIWRNDSTGTGANAHHDRQPHLIRRGPARGGPQA
jgi:hypothetical protein